MHFLSRLPVPPAHPGTWPGWAAPERLVSQFSTHPDPGALPGGQTLLRLMNGLDFWALALSLAGLLVGAAAWALGSHGQNYHQSYVGRRAVMISALAALLVGAGPAIVNFFFVAGQGVH
ncbi:MAG: DUF6112 family protein [Actinomycetota bacterium]|jgi:hypothetical protein|nr:DUF6112 family protein [Actinomycetota bacterium]